MSQPEHERVLAGDQDDPSAYATVVIGIVGTLTLVASVYFVSAVYYKSVTSLEEELLTTPASTELQRLMADQTSLLAERGTRRDAD